MRKGFNSYTSKDYCVRFDRVETCVPCRNVEYLGSTRDDAVLPLGMWERRGSNPDGDRLRLGFRG
jgi:hypothetical protein